MEVELLALALSCVALLAAEPCPRLLAVELTEFEARDDGGLLAGDLLYPPGMHWQEDNTTWGCLCLLTSCVRKCCPENMTHSSQEGSPCAYSNSSLLHPFRPELEDNAWGPVLVYGDPCAWGSYRLDPLNPESPDEQFSLLASGTLVTADGNFTPAQYCLDLFEDVGRILPLVCFPQEEEEAAAATQDVPMLYPIGMLVSLPFLLATLCVYALLGELQNLHGKSLMCHVACLFSAYTSLALVQLGTDSLPLPLCTACAFVILFSFHASFFWLNVMCFDIWWTFSGLRPLRGSVKEREYKKFIMYSCYAWGAPLLMLLVCLIMDLVPGISSSYIKPEFGVEKCWFKTKDAALAYFFGPIGVIVLCNIILFIATAVKILQLKRETKMLKGGESMRHDDEANRQRFNLYLKLFVVMGVNWIMEVISWVAGGPDYLWYITDLGNTLQGVLIFIIFVWKRKIRKLLAKKFNPKLADTSSVYDGSVRSRPSTRTSSVNYTTRTSVSSPPDQMVMVSMMKPVPNGTYRVTEVP